MANYLAGGCHESVATTSITMVSKERLACHVESCARKPPGHEQGASAVADVSHSLECDVEDLSEPVS